MLFNLKDDIGETEDLSEKYPEKVQELLKIWQEIDKRNGSISMVIDWENRFTLKIADYRFTIVYNGEFDC